MKIEDDLINYLKNHAGEEVAFDTPLVEDGIIDSMGVTELVAFVVETFHVELDMDDMTIENFGTINDIKNLIMRKRGDS
jgi:acyl carrier protein